MVFLRYGTIAGWKNIAKKNTIRFPICISTSELNRSLPYFNNHISGPLLERSVEPICIKQMSCSFSQTMLNSYKKNSFSKEQGLVAIRKYSDKGSYTTDSQDSYSTEDPWPVEIKLLKQEKKLVIDFEDGSSFNYPAEYLRVKSPASVPLRKDSAGNIRVPSGRSPVGILRTEPVGNYGIRVCFDDLHSTGIFTWKYLYELGNNKRKYMREYIKALHTQGLSRHPPRRK